MSAIDGAALARWWADRYTRGLPAEVRSVAEAELHYQRARAGLNAAP